MVSDSHQCGAYFLRACNVFQQVVSALTGYDSESVQTAPYAFRLHEAFANAF